MQDHLAAPERGPAPTRVKTIAGAAFIALVVIGLITWAMARPGSTSFYMTPTEIVALGPTEATAEYRVNGKVVPGSVQRDGITTRFEVTDGQSAVAVTTDRPLPDAFYSDTERVEVVAQGDYDGRVFDASQVFAKCPSKFKAKRS